MAELSMVKSSMVKVTNDSLRRSEQLYFGPPPLTDIKNPRLIYCKGFLFLLVGFLASGLLLFNSPSLRSALLLAISIWCFARFYYFAFYVIQHYVDDQYRFDGLLSFFSYALRQRFGWKRPPDDGDDEPE